jgi:hypothetical protein
LVESYGCRLKFEIVCGRLWRLVLIADLLSAFAARCAQHVYDVTAFVNEQ